MRKMFCRSMLAITFTLTAGTFLTGCGDSTQVTVKTANVKAGSMPKGAKWDGVYFSPLFGHLHLKQRGNLVEGRWLRPVRGRWGKLQGNADGNLLRFDWEEFVDGLVGPNSKKAGKGYFVYSRPEGDNIDDRIAGEVGRGASEVGNAWEAIKQRNMKPKLDSIGGAGASEVGGGDWDSPNADKKNDVEAPVEPGGEDDGPEL